MGKWIDKQAGKWLDKVMNWFFSCFFKSVNLFSCFFYGRSNAPVYFYWNWKMKQKIIVEKMRKSTPTESIESILVKFRVSWCEIFFFHKICKVFEIRTKKKYEEKLQLQKWERAGSCRNKRQSSLTGKSPNFSSTHVMEFHKKKNCKN